MTNQCATVSHSARDCARCGQNNRINKAQTPRTTTSAHLGVDEPCLESGCRAFILRLVSSKGVFVAKTVTMSQGMETFEARLASFDTVLNPGKRRGSSTKSVKPISWPHSSPSPAEVCLFSLVTTTQHQANRRLYRSWHMRASTMSPMRRTPTMRGVSCARVPWMGGRRKIIRLQST